MPDNESAESKGLFESLSTLGATLVAIVHTRLELLSVDLEEERQHLFSIMLLSLIAVFLLGIGVVMAAIMLVVVYWDTNRLLVLSILTMLFLFLGIATGIYAVHRARSKPRLFSSSLDELQKDQQQLSSKS